MIVTQIMEQRPPIHHMRQRRLRNSFDITAEKGVHWRIWAKWFEFQ